MSKLNIIVIFGGKSAEHEVSIKSAINIMSHIDRDKYNILPIWVNKIGVWFYIKSDTTNILDENTLQSSEKLQVALIRDKKPILFDMKHLKPYADIHLAFPIIHGPTGEDGIIQGFLGAMQVPFVGTNVLGSAICMDKVITKEILSKNNIKTAKYMFFNHYEKDLINCKKVVKELKLPFFIKPASLGSSIGISKVEKETDFFSAVETAFYYDNKIIIEECVQAREIECAILGNKDREIIVSNPGEIITTKSFYDYEAKYNDTSTKLVVPANLENNIVGDIKKLALKAYNILCCEDYARVDMFLDAAGTVFINEINTIPGFTEFSMFPLLMKTAGVSFDELVDKLLTYALTKKS